MFLLLPIGDVNPTERTPAVNYGLLAANIAVFAMFGLSPGYDRIVMAHGFVPRFPELADAFTSMFLHGGLAHLGGNMLFLWIVGDNVEDRLGWLGYLALYLASGLAAIGAHWALAPNSTIPCVGASGAIAGVLGAYVFLFPHSRIRIWYLVAFGILTTGIKEVAAMWAIGFWFLQQLLMQTYAMTSKAMTGVAYAAHVGGFVFGLLVVVLLWAVGLVRRSGSPAGAAIPRAEARYGGDGRRDRTPWDGDRW